MDRQYTKVDIVRSILDDEIKKIEDEEQKRCAYVHLYGVGQAAAFLAMKRGFGREFAELAEIAGMLHDYAKYVCNEEDYHAEKSSRHARLILEKGKVFPLEDIDIVCDAIYNHSRKQEIGNAFCEVIKDADEMQHFFRNPTENYFYEKERVQKLLKELI